MISKDNFGKQLRERKDGDGIYFAFEKICDGKYALIKILEKDFSKYSMSIIPVSKSSGIPTVIKVYK